MAKKSKESMVTNTLTSKSKKVTLKQHAGSFKETIAHVNNLNKSKIELITVKNDVPEKAKAGIERNIKNFRMLAEKTIDNKGFTVLEHFVYKTEGNIKHSVVLGYSSPDFRFKIGLAPFDQNQSRKTGGKFLKPSKIFENIFDVCEWLGEEDVPLANKTMALNKIRDQASRFYNNLATSPEAFFKKINSPTRPKVDGVIMKEQRELAHA